MDFSYGKLWNEARNSAREYADVTKFLTACVHIWDKSVVSANLLCKISALYRHSRHFLRYLGWIPLDSM